MEQTALQEALKFRPAAETDAACLTELALRSKAHWDYDAEFLEACRAELTIVPEYVASHTIFVLEEKGKLLGFYSLERQADENVELVHLFVEPDAIGKGYGKLLWTHAVEKSRQLGFHEMIIQSDPFAEAFYLAMGARRVGVIASGVLQGRTLPLLRFSLNTSGC
jgi:GNAT superfamily N-acetyltransferase